MRAPRRFLGRFILRTIRLTIKTVIIGAVVRLAREQLIGRNRVAYGPEPLRRK
jgi:hypothetical protein